MDTGSSSSILSNKLIEDNYKLALKFFVNRDVHNSWVIISSLYQQAIKEYEKGLIGEKLLTKIVSLYLIEIGYNLNNNRDQALTNSLRNKTIINNLAKVFTTLYNIPDEILYNYYLIHVTNWEYLIDGNRQFFEDLDQLYMNYKSFNNGKFYQQLIDLYTFEILPMVNKVDQARMIIETNQIYANKRDYAKSKLSTIEKSKTDAEIKQKQINLEKQKQQQEEKLKKDQQLKLQREKQLEYVKLNELSKSRDLSIPPQSNQPKLSQLQVLKSRVTYLLSISSNYLKQSSPLILVVIMTILISTRFINYRKLNLRQKLKQTIEMAFKVSYL